MILPDETRAEYLRVAMTYVDGLPLLMSAGRHDQVLHELARIRSTIDDVRRSLEPEPVHIPPMAECEE